VVAVDENDGKEKLWRLNPNLNIITAAQGQREGQVILTSAPLGESVMKLSVLVDGKITDRETLIMNLREELAGTGVFIGDQDRLGKDKNGTAQLDHDELAVINRDSMVIEVVPGLGTVVGLDILFHVDKSYQDMARRLPLQLTDLRRVKHEPSPMEKDYSGFDRPVEIGINGVSGRTGSQNLKIFVEDIDPKFVRVRSVLGGSREKVRDTLMTDSTRGRWLDRTRGDKIELGEDKEGEYISITREGKTYPNIYFIKPASKSGKDPYKAYTEKDFDGIWEGTDFVLEYSNQHKSVQSLKHHHVDLGGAKVAALGAPTASDGYLKKLYADKLKSGEVTDKDLKKIGKEGVVSVLMGVNHKAIPDNIIGRILDFASCTSNDVAAPIFAMMYKMFSGLEEGESALLKTIAVTIHGSTGSNQLMDQSGRNDKKSLSAPQGMIITTTGATTAVAHALPPVKDVLFINAWRVPGMEGSVTPLINYFRVPKGQSLNKDIFNNRFREFAADDFSGIITVDNQGEGDHRSSVSTHHLIGSNARSHLYTQGTQVKSFKGGEFARVLSFQNYANEGGYPHSPTDGAIEVGRKILAQEKAAVVDKAMLSVRDIGDIAKLNPESVMVAVDWNVSRDGDTITDDSRIQELCRHLLSY